MVGGEGDVGGGGGVPGGVAAGQDQEAQGCQEGGGVGAGGGHVHRYGSILGVTTRMRTGSSAVRRADPSTTRWPCCGS